MDVKKSLGTKIMSIVFTWVIALIAITVNMYAIPNLALRKVFYYLIPIIASMYTVFRIYDYIVYLKQKENEKDVTTNSNDQRLSILNLELENRFSSFLNHIEKPNKNWGVFKTFIVASENILNGRCNAYVSKDFKMTPTLQLLLELKDITKNEDKLNDISDAITGIRKLSKIILPGWGDTKMNATPENNRIKIQNEILLIIKTSNFSKWC